MNNRKVKCDQSDAIFVWMRVFLNIEFNIEVLSNNRDKTVPFNF